MFESLPIHYLAWVTAFIGAIVVVYLLTKGGAAQKIKAAYDANGNGELDADEKSVMVSHAKTLKWAALGIELLSISLTLAWASTARDDGFTPVIFCIGFACFVLVRMVAVPEAVKAWTRREMPRFWAMAALSCLTILSLLATSAFDLLNDSGNAAVAKLQASAPAIALNAQIELAQTRIDGLANYADANQARQEASSIAAANRANASKAERLEQEISALLNQHPNNSRGRRAERTLGGLTNKCASDYSGFYASQCGPVRAKRTQLSKLGGNSATGEYGSNHAAYVGQKAHLAGLLQQRAELGANGVVLQDMWRPEDKFIAWMLGITPEQANSIKWIIFAALFDIIALIARIAAQLLLSAAGGDAFERMRRRINAYNELGVDIDAVVMPKSPTQQATAGFAPGFHSAGATASSEPNRQPANTKSKVGFFSHQETPAPQPQETSPAPLSPASLQEPSDSTELEKQAMRFLRGVEQKKCRDSIEGAKKYLRAGHTRAKNVRQLAHEMRAAQHAG